VCKQSHEAAITLVKPDASSSETKEDLSAVAASPAQEPETRTTTTPTTAPDSKGVPDPDLHRAQELVSLHYDVKVNHLRSGLDPELVEARRRVDEVLASLT